MPHLETTAGSTGTSLTGLAGESSWNFKSSWADASAECATRRMSSEFVTQTLSLVSHRARRGFDDSPHRTRARRSFARPESLPSQTPDTPAANATENAFTYRRNWGRWGATNQITARQPHYCSKARCCCCVSEDGTHGVPRPDVEPEQHFIRVNQRGTGGSVVDYYGFLYHGVTVTHVDALCHVWDRNGMWNGRDPAKEIDTNGTRFADITAFSGGLITRGVLLDVPRHRRVSYVVTGNDRSTGRNSKRSPRLKASSSNLETHCWCTTGREAFVRSVASVRPLDRCTPGFGRLVCEVHPRS